MEFASNHYETLTKTGKMKPDKAVKKDKAEILHEQEEENKPKKKKHMKSNSNVEEFAFNDVKPLEDKLHNFVNNYDGKCVYNL